LEPGFSQAIYGVAVMPTGAGMAGPAFAPNGDPLVVDCGATHGQPLIRFLGASTTTVNGTVIHNSVSLPSNAGCGLTNHPNGALYTATDRGVVKLDANTGAPLLGPFGGPGLSTGIAVDPQTGNLVFQSGTGGFDFGTISEVDPALTSVSTFSKVFFGNSIISAMAFDPTGNYLFVATVSPRRVTILNRSGVAVNAVPISSTTGRPVGIAFFHAGAVVFAVTNNDDGTMTRFDFPGNDFTQPPTQRVFASGGFDGPFPGNGHVQLGPDGCLYASQGQTRYDNGVVDDTHHHSLVQICPRGGVADNITLTPATQHAPAGTPQAVTATVRDVLGAVQSGVSVKFDVTSGPDAGSTFTGPTSNVGQAGFTFSGSVPGTDVVQASFVDASGSKQVSNLVQVIFTLPSPAAPTGLTAIAGSAKVSLSWTAPPGPVHYNVKRATVTGGPYTTIATLVLATSFLDTGLANGTTYFYVVSAVNAGGESPNSNEAQATPTAPQAGVNYVALGDSYSAGEGIPGTFLPGTDSFPFNVCHRSSEAYSQLLGQTYGLQPKFYACSGAETSDILTTSWQGSVDCTPPQLQPYIACKTPVPICTPQPDGGSSCDLAFIEGEPPQIIRPGVDRTASLVTLTIGGNDAGFADGLSFCIKQKLWADFTNFIGQVAIWTHQTTDPSCANSPAFVNSAIATINAVFGPAKNVYKNLRNAVDPAQTSIIVAGYPHLVADSPDASCPALQYLTVADMQLFNNLADRLDPLLQRAAGQAGVNFVDVRPAFTGHGLCGSGGSWINGIDLKSPGGSPIQGSFHPTEAGQADGYARAIRDYIDSATNVTRQGYPANPAPLPDPPFATESPSVVVQALAVQPATTGSSAECEGTYQAGQKLSVVGQGFAPGASVQLFITSPGLGPTAEQQVAQVTADSAGNIATIVRIPLAATGFNLPGAQAGVVFADAIGLGPDGAHVDDIAPMKLVPHGSTCGTVEPFPFIGFDPPIKNLPEINAENPGRTIPVKFALAGSNAILTDVLAAGYPQSAPVACSEAPLLTTGDPTSPAPSSSGSAGDEYQYNWETSKSWSGCRELIVKVVDGSYHRAVFDFGAS
jgi:hypothetical protein